MRSSSRSASESGSEACWATVAIGVMCGVDRLWVALAVTVIALVVLEFQYVGITTWLANRARFHRLERDSDPLPPD